MNDTETLVKEVNLFINIFKDTLKNVSTIDINTGVIPETSINSSVVNENDEDKIVSTKGPVPKNTIKKQKIDKEIVDNSELQSFCSSFLTCTVHQPLIYNLSVKQLEKSFKTLRYPVLIKRGSQQFLINNIVEFQELFPTIEDKKEILFLQKPLPTPEVSINLFVWDNKVAFYNINTGFVAIFDNEKKKLNKEDGCYRLALIDKSENKLYVVDKYSKEDWVSIEKELTSISEKSIEDYSIGITSSLDDIIITKKFPSLNDERRNLPLPTYTNSSFAFGKINSLTLIKELLNGKSVIKTINESPFENHVQKRALNLNDLIEIDEIGLNYSDENLIVKNTDWVEKLKQIEEAINISGTLVIKGARIRQLNCNDGLNIRFQAEEITLNKKSKIFDSTSSEKIVLHKKFETDMNLYNSDSLKINKDINKPTTNYLEDSIQPSVLWNLMSKFDSSKTLKSLMSEVKYFSVIIKEDGYCYIPNSSADIKLFNAKDLFKKRLELSIDNLKVEMK